MLQKPEDARQERFLNEVKKLNLRFPNREIAEKTGYKSGIISEYLNSKKLASEKFLREFSEAFGINYDTTFTISPFSPDDDFNWERAAIKALTHQLAKAMSKIAELSGGKRPVEDCLQDIEQSTTLILNDLRRSSKKK
jgi:transcriptional regulator with XRE-family HTH domain